MVEEGGLYERIRPDAVDLTAGTLTFKTQRLFPLIATSGDTSRQLMWSLEVGVEDMELLKRGEDYEVWGATALHDRIAPLAEAVGNHYAAAWNHFVDYPLRGYVYLHIIDIDDAENAAGVAGGLNCVELDLVHGTDLNTVAHEYFHLIQFNYTWDALTVRGHFRADAENLKTMGRWMAEASANYMGYQVENNPAALASYIRRLDNEFCYRALTTAQETTVPLTREPHEYQSMIFLHYLAQYYDIDEVLLL